MAKAKTKTEEVVIPKPTIAEFSVKLIGTAPLVQQKFTKKAQRQIEEKQQNRARKVKAARDPRDEFLQACEVYNGKAAGDKGCVYAIPSRQVKAAMVDACRFVDGLPMTIARCAMHVHDKDGGDMLKLTFRGTHPKMRTDAVTLKSGSLDLRYRPQYDGWSTQCWITYNADKLSASQIVNLLSLAGFHCGLAELRPNAKKGAGGSMGLFEVKQVK